MGIAPDMPTFTGAVVRMVCIIVRGCVGTVVRIVPCILQHMGTAMQIVSVIAPSCAGTFTKVALITLNCVDAVVRIAFRYSLSAVWAPP